MDWEFPLLFTVGMALIGASVLFGKDYMKRQMAARVERGEPPMPDLVTFLVIFLLMVLFLVGTAAFGLALAGLLSGRHG